MRRRIVSLAVLLCVCSGAAWAQDKPAGVWVSVFSQKKVLYSREAASALIETCRKAGIGEIYLQLYQSGRAYYDTVTLDRDKYADMVASAGGDMADFIIRQAAENNIKVFAWVNILSLGVNESAPILKRYGRGVLTRDQYDRPSGRKDRNDTDDYYQREDQLFLEPGDPRVVKFSAAVVEEIAARYKGLSGVHLDYVRYPMTVPFIPGSKFTDYGLSYGLSQVNAARFKEAVGIDPLKGLGRPADFESWDNWRRSQVTAVVRECAARARAVNARLAVSAAVIPSSERAYTSMFQDWTSWLADGAVDYVVLMTYSPDPALIKMLVRAASGLRGRGKIYAGLGAFLFKDSPSSVAAQYAMLRELQPDGIVFFAYDDLTPEVVSLLHADDPSAAQ